MQLAAVAGGPAPGRGPALGGRLRGGRDRVDVPKGQPRPAAVVGGQADAVEARLLEDVLRQCGVVPGAAHVPGVPQLRPAGRGVVACGHAHEDALGPLEGDLGRVPARALSPDDAADLLQVLVLLVALEAVARQEEPVGEAAEDPPAVALEAVPLHHEMPHLPALAAAREVPAEDDAAAVVVVAPVVLDQAVAARAVHDDDPAVPEVRLGGVVLAAGQAVEGGLVADEHGGVRSAQPEAIAAVVGGVSQECVARAPGLETVVVGEAAVVLDEDVAHRDPAVQRADEDPVAPVGDVVALEAVVVAAGLDQHAGGVARVHLAGLHAQAP